MVYGGVAMKIARTWVGLVSIVYYILFLLRRTDVTYREFGDSASI